MMQSSYKLFAFGLLVMFVPGAVVGLITGLIVRIALQRPFTARGLTFDGVLGGAAFIGVLLLASALQGYDVVPMDTNLHDFSVAFSVATCLPLLYELLGKRT